MRHKLLGFLYALILLTPAALYAEPISLHDGKLELGGQVRIRYEHVDNTDFVSAKDGRDFVLTRVRPYLKFNPHEQISVLFQPQFTGGWGETGASLTSVNSGIAAGTSTSGGTLNDPALGLHQAYMIYSPTDWFSMKLGRQELVYGDHLVIGNVGWNNVGRSFDAAKFKFKHHLGWVDFILSYISDAESGMGRLGSGAVPAGDRYLVGVYSSMDLGTYAKALDFYLLYNIDDTVAPKPFNFITGGVRLKSKPSAWDYRIEATGQYGKPVQAAAAGTTQKAFQIDAEGGYSFGTDEQYRIAIEAFVASLNYNQLFPTAHKWLGFIDLFGRRNIMGGVIHFSAKPIDRWTFKLDAHTIFRYKNTSTLFTLGGTGALGAGASTSRFAGEEIDLSAHYKPLDMLTFSAGVNVFIPVGFLKANVGNKMPIFGYLQSNLSF